MCPKDNSIYLPLPRCPDGCLASLDMAEAHLVIRAGAIEGTGGYGAKFRGGANYAHPRAQVAALYARIVELS